jgi:hypothetical protein
MEVSRLAPRLNDAEARSRALAVDLESTGEQPFGFHLDDTSRATWKELCADLDAKLMVWPDGVCGLVCNTQPAHHSLTLQGSYSVGRHNLECAVLMCSSTSFGNA